MRKYLINLIILVIPLSSFAVNDPLIQKKFNILKEAERHRQEATNALKKADEMCVYIPNLDDRKHMHTIIGSILTAAFIPEPTTKTYILAVGLPLLASLSTDVYDKFCEYRELLVSIDYHIDMVKFYEKLSIKISEKATNNKDVQAFLQSIDCITYCQMLTFTTEDEIARGAITKLKYLRNYLIDDFGKSHYTVTKNMIDRAWVFYENLAEMLAESEDELLVNKLFYNTREMIINLEAAYRLSRKSTSGKTSGTIIFNSEK